MILPRTTVCNVFKINAPIWNGGKKMVGLRENAIGEHNEIEFTYRRKTDNELSMPEHYYISGSKIRNLDFGRQVTKGTTLVIVPFDQLEILYRGDEGSQEEFIQWLNDPRYSKNINQLKEQ